MPQYYDLKLISFIHEGNFTFHGEVTILVNVLISSFKITLHAKNLHIDHISLLSNLWCDDQVSIEKVSKDTERQFLIIYLNEPVKAQKQYFINIKFRGILNDDFYRGFFRTAFRWDQEVK